MLAAFVLSTPLVVFSEQGEENNRLEVTPWSVLRYKHMHRQVYEFTCGAASLSSVIRYFLGKDVSERDVLRLIREYYPDDESWEKAQKEGLSFLDLKKAAVGLGMSAQAYRLSFSDLAKLRFPVIVHLDKVGYQHFSVVKGVAQDRVWLADPIRGNVRDSVLRFSREWSGLVLVIWDSSASPSLESELAFIRDVRLAEDDIRQSIIKTSVNQQSTFNPYPRR